MYIYKGALQIKLHDTVVSKTCCMNFFDLHAEFYYLGGGEVLYIEINSVFPLKKRINLNLAKNPNNYNQICPKMQTFASGPKEQLPVGPMPQLGTMAGKIHVYVGPMGRRTITYRAIPKKAALMRLFDHNALVEGVTLSC